MVHFTIFQGLFTAHFSQEEIAAEERRRDSFLRDAGRSAVFRRSPAASPERWGDEGFFGVQTEPNGFFMLGYGYGSIPINTIFRGMNIHLPAILMWTTGVQGFDTLPYHRQFFRIWLFIIMVWVWKWSIINYPQIYSRAMKKSDQTLKWSLNEISWKSAEGENMEDDTNEIGKYGQLWRTIEKQHNICVVMWWLLYSELFIGCAQVWLTSHLQAHNGSTWYSEHTLCHKVSSGRNSTENQLKLVGGFKHVLLSIIYGIILSIDFHIFQRG